MLYKTFLLKYTMILKNKTLNHKKIFFCFENIFSINTKIKY